MLIRSYLIACMALSFIVLSVPASAQDHTGHDVMREAAKDMGGDPAVDDLNAAMAKMHRDMAVPITGDPDADFIRGMIPHHQGAIDMAQIVIKYGDDPEARQLARTILRAQRGEIAWMKRWLERRQLSATEPMDLRR